MEHPHRRYNLLTGEWVLVSPQRSKRPWQGKKEEKATIPSLKYDEKCYLCPTNTRISGNTNPNYDEVYVFDNDFPALLRPDQIKIDTSPENEWFISEVEQGICRVICFSPRHDQTISELPLDKFQKVAHQWKIEYEKLAKKEWINYIQIFENKGAMMGCSNPHPHGQIWATTSIPNEIRKESIQFSSYYQQHQKTLLSGYLEAEIKAKERIVCQNEDFVALVPYWAVWPFEILVIARQSVASLVDLDTKALNNLAAIYQDVSITYDHLFDCSFPYSAGIHQAPCDGKEHPEWHLHLHFYPPLLRSATVRKFMVGYEMLATPQRDLTAEQAAQRLRAARP